LAVIIFNNGFLPILKVLSVMGVTIGEETEMYVNCCNKTRINLSELRISDITKKARTDQKKERTAQHLFQEEEGPLYGPGLAN
ncbi:hypothetical protein WH47_08386, partial [Habropoda laboriosa]